MSTATPLSELVINMYKEKPSTARWYLLVAFESEFIEKEKYIILRSWFWLEIYNRLQYYKYWKSEKTVTYNMSELIKYRDNKKLPNTHHYPPATISLIGLYVTIINVESIHRMRN